MSDTSPDIKKENNTPKPQNSLESLNSILAFQVQDLIDKKLDKAESRLRDYTFEKWKIWGYIAAALSVFMGVAGYEYIKNSVKKLVEDKMTVPALIKATEDTISKKMPELVETKFKSLEEKTGKLSEYIETTKDEIREKQSSLESVQELLKEQLNIQLCVVAAKAGKRDKYEELKRSAEKKLEYKELVDAALKDIEFYYEAIKYQLVVPMLMDSISKKDPGYSIEEVIYEYRESDVKLDLRESAIDTLIAYYKEGKIKENIVQELCESVDSEQNLRVIARTTLLLNYLTEKLFRSLEIDAVREWWKQNNKETKYQSPYKEYLKVREDMTHGINTGNAQQFIPLLDKTIKANPDAFHARCLRGFILIFLKDYPNAEKELEIVEERNKAFRWLLLYKSLLFACQNKIDEAVDLLNQALAKSPVLKSEAENLAKYFTEYKKVVEKENVKWPSDKQ
jgi:hypothetical protein